MACLNTLAAALRNDSKKSASPDARHLLESDKGYTVTNVAARCGYRSANLFYTHYRELVGHSPRTRKVNEPFGEIRPQGLR